MPKPNSDEVTARGLPGLTKLMLLWCYCPNSDVREGLFDPPIYRAGMQQRLTLLGLMNKRKLTPEGEAYRDILWADEIDRIGRRVGNEFRDRKVKFMGPNLWAKGLLFYNPTGISVAAEYRSALLDRLGARLVG